MTTRSWIAVGALTLAAGGVGYFWGAPTEAPQALIPAAPAPAATEDARPVETGTPARPSPTPAPVMATTPPPRRAPPPVPITPPSEPPEVPRPRPAIEPGALRTADAFDHPDMRAMDPSDASYDPVIEAQQHFHAFERALLEAPPADLAAWTAIKARFQPDYEAMLARSVELAQTEYGDESEALLVEWGDLEAEQQGDLQ